MSVVNDVYYYTDKLKELLREKGNVQLISLEFFKISSNKDRIKFLQKCLEDHDLLPKDYGKLKLEKSDKISELYRQKGNTAYSEKKFLDALVFYNQSLCFAENVKNLGLAYANRSAVFFEMELFEACIENIKFARENEYPKDKMEKLNNREASSHKMINEKKFFDKNQRTPVGEDFLKLSHKSHPTLPFISGCLELKSDDKFGRYVVTTKDLTPGQVVAIEDPFTTYLLPDSKYKACHNCLQDNFLNLIPCKLSVSAMFCSEKCSTDAFNKFYKYEVDIIDKLNSICTKILRIAIRTFFEALQVCDGDVNELKALVAENEGADSTIFDFKDPFDKKNIFRAIDALQSNEKGRDNSDKFQRCGIVAVICDIFFKHTKLSEKLETEDDRDFFRSFVFKQSQIAACNYHGLYHGVMKRSELDNDPQVGSGSFPFCSLINHSCSPNLVRVTLNNKNYVVINRPIKAGGQLFDNYGLHHCLEDLKTRQNQLLGQYMFKCGCEACVNQFPLFPQLKAFDRSFDIAEDITKLQKIDVEHAKKYFAKICKYLTKNDKYYPCYEISAMQECLLRCFTIFRLSEFKIKCANE